MSNDHMLLHFLRPDPAAAACSPRSFSSSSASVSDDDGYSCSSFPTTDGAPTPKSPWAHFPGLGTGGAVAEPGATGLVASLVKEDGHVYSLAATGDVLYTGTDSRNMRVWRDQRELAGFRTASGLVKAIVVREKAAKSDATKHVLEKVLRKGESAVTTIAVSPEDLVVYVGSSDGLVTYWHWVDGEARYDGVLKGHKMAVICLAVAGNVVVSDSAGRTLCVWRRDGAEHVGLAVLAGHTGPVKCVAMDEEAASSSGGDRRFVVYSGSLDGSVKVWRLSDAEAACPVSALVMERTPAPPQPSQAWRGRPAPGPYVEAWALYQTPELKRVRVAAA